MTRDYTSNYAVIDEDHNRIKLYDKYPLSTGFLTKLQNVKVLINGDTIEIQGDEIMFDFTFYSKDLSEFKNEPHENYVHMRYKNIIHFFRGIKTPYVKSGWYRLKETQPYKTITNKWTLTI
jgi:hypothetical protein